MKEDYVLNRRIFETITGSRAYGINNPDSDYDRIGVVIPGKEYFFGFKKFEQYDNFEYDRTLYNIHKVIQLIKSNNPNMMDLLWMPEKNIIFITPYWERIIENRDLFISKRIRYTYSGYAVSQLRRIKTHRKFLLNPPATPPTRKSFGLPKISIFPTIHLKSVLYAVIEIISKEEKHNFVRELDSIYSGYVIPLLERYIKEEEHKIAMEWLQLGIKSQSKAFLSLGTKYLKEEYLDMAMKEIKFYVANKEWTQYCSWKKHRNKSRATLEEKYGYDSKHAAHLIRLMRTGEEALKTGFVNVDRTNIDANELKAIRKGAWTFDQVEQFTEEYDKKLAHLYEKSKLQHSPQEEKIEKLSINVIEDYLYNQKTSKKMTG